MAGAPTEKADTLPGPPWRSCRAVVACTGSGQRCVGNGVVRARPALHRSQHWTAELCGVQHRGLLHHARVPPPPPAHLQDDAAVAAGAVEHGGPQWHVGHRVYRRAAVLRGVVLAHALRGHVPHGDAARRAARRQAGVAHGGQRQAEARRGVGGGAQRHGGRRRAARRRAVRLAVQHHAAAAAAQAGG